MAIFQSIGNNPVLKPLCLRGLGSYNGMLICSKVSLQLKQKPPVQELDNVVSEWVRKYPNLEWAHLFYYMIHFPIPNRSLAPCNATARESVENCGRIVREKAGSGFGKSGGEYFLDEGIGPDAILSSQEFQSLETKWKTKTEFWQARILLRGWNKWKVGKKLAVKALFRTRESNQCFQ